MENGVERLAALSLLLTALSHIAAPAAWAKLFARIRSAEEASGLLIAGLHLPLGLVIAAFHPVWAGPGLLVTLIGWALVVKGTLHLLIPSLARRGLSFAEQGGALTERRYRLAGIVMVPLAGAVGWIALR